MYHRPEPAGNTEPCHLNPKTLNPETLRLNPEPKTVNPNNVGGRGLQQLAQSPCRSLDCKVALRALKTSPTDPLRPKYYDIIGIWALQPYLLDPWTLGEAKHAALGFLLSFWYLNPNFRGSVPSAPPPP